MFVENFRSLCRYSPLLENLNEDKKRFLKVAQLPITENKSRTRNPTLILSSFFPFKDKLAKNTGVELIWRVSK